ncbi:acyltransferase [Gammaproteobacteria bacterium]|nr:acyltransferase [Gammaproteobacteria bacterium]
MSRNTILRSVKGTIEFNCKPKFGLVLIGFNGPPFCDHRFTFGTFDLKGSILFFGTARIGIGTNICVDGALEIGNDFQTNGSSSIICHDRISFGEAVLVSWDVTIIDTDMHSIFSEDNILVNPNKLISVGSNVWIGFGATILKGSFLPEGSVIAANALISGALVDGPSVYAGRNALLKKNIIWKR